QRRVEPLERPRQWCVRLPALYAEHTHSGDHAVPWGSAHRSGLRSGRAVGYRGWHEYKPGVRQLQRRVRLAEDVGLARSDDAEQLHLWKSVGYRVNHPGHQPMDRSGRLQSTVSIWAAVLGPEIHLQPVLCLPAPIVQRPTRYRWKDSRWLVHRSDPKHWERIAQ